MQPIEKVIRLRFITAITSRCICSDEWEEVALQIKFGGLDLLDYYETQNIENQNSSKVPKDVTGNMNLQNKSFPINTEKIKEQVEIRQKFNLPKQNNRK